jgi:DNA-binding NarL/FixJ family response regulator
MIKLAIADDHKLFRMGLINLLSEAKEIDVVAQASNGDEAIQVAKEFHPDIFIMDITMPVKNGIEATAAIAIEAPDVKVIAISMHSERSFIKGMLEAGAWGFLLKSCNYNQVLDAIKTVMSGKKYLDGEVTDVLINDYVGNTPREESGDDVLSKRELEILKLYAEGKSSQEIADILFISVKTVGTHKQNVLDKLNLSSTADLVKYALKKGMITL